MNQDTTYNSYTCTIGMLHVVLVDDQIKLNLLLIASQIDISVRSELGKCGTSGNSTVWCIQNKLHLIVA